MSFYTDNVKYDGLTFEYCGRKVVEVKPFDRCKFKVGILINNEVEFFRFVDD